MANYETIQAVGIVTMGVVIVVGTLWADRVSTLVNRIPKINNFTLAAILILTVLSLLFKNVLIHSERIMFSNDGPLGTQVSERNSSANTWDGYAWNDLNWLGYAEVTQSIAGWFSRACFYCLIGYILYKLFRLFRPKK